MFAPALTILSFFSGVGFCKLYEDVADLPGLQYDFVIVGGGTAGSVLASRLTENATVSVLVLEAGPSNVGVLDAQVPFLSNGVSDNGTSYSWNYTTTPQAGASNHTFEYLRGYILGGCSSHNGMAYTRGAAEDFDRYATLTGDDGWSWNKIFPYFLKNEQWTAPADNHDTHGQFNPKVHGTAGPIEVSISGYPWTEFQQRVMQTTKELPDDFPFNLDMNSGKPLGVGWLQYTIGHGERSSSATGYLEPKIIQRPNLDVLLHAQVSKLVNVTKSRVTPSAPFAFQGVEFRYGNSLFVAKASKEIILSAGPIGTPQILMNSGIGDRSALQALGITTVLDLPSVGKNASEHPYFGMSWAVNSNQTVESITQNATRFNEAFAEWNRSRTGPFVDPSPGTHAGWFRLNANSSVFDLHSDPSPGPEAPHFEMLFQPFGFMDLPGHFISLTMAMVSPVSRGSVTLSSNDPFAPPLIDLGLLSSDFDALALTEGINLAFKFASAPAWNGYLGEPTVNLTAMSSAELTAYIRANLGPGYHVVGTAGMSAREAQYGVVDPDLKVKGIAGLRVIDASVLPIVPAAHTQAATYVVAERGADMVKQTWM
ncbi:Aryl-alcohol oxidase [Mycena sanguinolenta]|uniref:Aryl-alcohol oxidase n=1 Tax=Mycena sanguinolenta TaxID=230812 RepID=A0A8H6XLW7_9AGAR|nr:Aryl-alcohol oxidase [Mycena sanguinolenta]